MKFKQFINEGFATGKLLGFGYAPAADCLGINYPLAYAIPKVSDIMFYYEIS